MTSIAIRPARYRQFGDASGCAFWLVTNHALKEAFRIEEASGYAEVRIAGCDSSEEFLELLATRMPEPAHVLVILPHSFFYSPPPARIGRRKLMAMACNSTPTSLETIAYFLDVIERTDPAAQQAFADRFFTLGEASDHLEFVDVRNQTYAQGTHATFEHLSDHYEWNQQAGPLDWGMQQLAPAGEISVLPVQILRFDAALRLPINGELAFHGQPVLHAGTPSFTREDQARIHERLATMGAHAVVATVRNGVVDGLRATHPDATPAVEMLEALYTVDSRFRIIWEVGFGINTALRALLPGNHAMNEVHGGSGFGALHYGMGLTPFTQYHLDIICPGTSVLGKDGALLFGCADGAELASHARVPLPPSRLERAMVTPQVSQPNAAATPTSPMTRDVQVSK
jgi:hypothetical protein